MVHMISVFSSVISLPVILLDAGAQDIQVIEAGEPLSSHFVTALWLLIGLPARIR